MIMFATKWTPLSPNCPSCDQMNTLSPNYLGLSPNEHFVTKWSVCDPMIILWSSGLVCWQVWLIYFGQQIKIFQKSASQSLDLYYMFVCTVWMWWDVCMMHLWHNIVIGDFSCIYPINQNLPCILLQSIINQNLPCILLHFCLDYLIFHYPIPHFSS